MNRHPEKEVLKVKEDEDSKLFLGLAIGLIYTI
jgi:hypothetical protein